MKIRSRTLAAALALATAAALAPGAVAQAPGIKRTLMQRSDIGDSLK